MRAFLTNVETQCNCKRLNIVNSTRLTQYKYIVSSSNEKSTFLELLLKDLLTKDWEETSIQVHTAKICDILRTYAIFM